MEATSTNLGKSTTSRARQLLDVMARVVWVVALAAIGFATFEGYVIIDAADSAPQQAAGAAMASFHAIAPYTLARGIESLLR